MISSKSYRTVKPVTYEHEQDEDENGGGDEQQRELESIIRDLEEENTFLIDEYTRLQHQLGSRGAPPGPPAKQASYQQLDSKIRQPSQGGRHIVDYGVHPVTGYHSVRALSSSPTPMQAAQRSSATAASYCTFLNQPTSNGSLNNNNTNTNNGSHYHHNYHNPMVGSMTLNTYNRVPYIFKSTAAKCGESKESELLLKEARALREHEDKLEARMKILENHNRLLDSQLKQLKSLLNNVKKNVFFLIINMIFDFY